MTEEPDDITSFVGDALVEHKILKSKGEFKRLVEQGGIKVIPCEIIVMIGKKRIYRLVWSEE